MFQFAVVGRDLLEWCWGETEETQCTSTLQLCMTHNSGTFLHCTAVHHMHTVPVGNCTLDKKGYFLSAGGHRQDLGDVPDIIVALNGHIRHEYVDGLRVRVGVQERAVTCGEECSKHHPPARLGQADVYVVKPETIRVSNVKRACICQQETLEGLHRQEFAAQIHLELLEQCSIGLFCRAVPLQWHCM